MAASCAVATGAPPNPAVAAGVAAGQAALAAGADRRLGWRLGAEAAKAAGDGDSKAFSGRT